MGRIIIPHGYEPRGYQRPFYNSIAKGYKRGVAIWHRRAGKDKTSLNLIIKEMFKRVGVYYYFFPTYSQGRKTIWEGIDADGFRFLDHFPPEIVDGTPNTTDMKIKATNGSLFQIIGTDKFNRIVGPNPVGCIFSEYSLQDPRAWNLVRPILAENRGWAVFIYTPRGKNHGWDLWHMAKDNPKWFSELLTVEDTKRPDGSPVITEEAIEDDRKEGMSEDMVQQEYYCSFLLGVEGAYYVWLLNDAQQQGRIRHVPIDKSIPVNTAWDLGFDDANTIWFYQVAGPWINIVDYYESSGMGLGEYMKVLEQKGQEYNFVYGEHYFPHDIEVHDLSQEGNLTRREYLEKEWHIKVNVIPRIKSQNEGIEAVRWVLPKCYFDEIRCEDGLNCLGNYRREWDEKNKIYRNYPLRDWASHGAKAMETLAFAAKGAAGKKTIAASHQPDTAETGRESLI